ncbi:spore germination protein [Neobacillus sp. FSL H8-0543]|uniref:spore germination protein n=1 Tax=Neobacillus sp. FSL H8-0543 TaxID=2954672 RepID=UPI0031589339
MSVNQDGVTIGTVSGGIVNFGGAVYISPISVTKANSGAGDNNTGEEVTACLERNRTNQKSVTELLELIKTMLG